MSTHRKLATHFKLGRACVCVCESRLPLEGNASVWLLYYYVSDVVLQAARSVQMSTAGSVWSVWSILGLQWPSLLHARRKQQTNTHWKHTQSQPKPVCLLLCSILLCDSEEPCIKIQLKKKKTVNSCQTMSFDSRQQSKQSIKVVHSFLFLFLLFLSFRYISMSWILIRTGCIIPQTRLVTQAANRLCSDLKETQPEHLRLHLWLLNTLRSSWTQQNKPSGKICCSTPWDVEQQTPRDVQSLRESMPSACHLCQSWRQLVN